MLTPSFAFKDVAKDHWAYPHIEYLQKNEIFKGYDDDTFRGENKITRYEIVQSLKNLKDKLLISKYKDQKILAEFRNILSVHKSRLKKLPKLIPSFSSRFLHSEGNLLFFQRASLNIMGENYLIDFDTTDSSRNTLAGLIGVSYFEEFNDDLLLILTYGTDDIVYSGVSEFPSETNIVMERPRPKVEIATTFEKIRIKTALSLRDGTNNGIYSIRELESSFSYTFFSFPLLNKLRLTLEPRAFFSDTAYDMRANFIIYQAFSTKINNRLEVGLGHKDSTKGMAVFYEGNLKDPFNSGTYLSLRASWIGSEFRTFYAYNILDIFSRPIPDNYTNLALSFRQALTRAIDLYSQSSVLWENDNNSNVQTWEIGLKCSKIPFKVFYKNYSVVNGSPYGTTGDLNTNLVGWEISL